MGYVVFLDNVQKVSFSFWVVEDSEGAEIEEIYEEDIFCAWGVAEVRKWWNRTVAERCDIPFARSEH